MVGSRGDGVTDVRYISIDLSLTWLANDSTDIGSRIPRLGRPPRFIRVAGKFLPLQSSRCDVVLCFWNLTTSGILVRSSGRCTEYCGLVDGSFFRRIWSHAGATCSGRHSGRRPKGSIRRETPVRTVPPTMAITAGPHLDREASLRRWLRPYFRRVAWMPDRYLTGDRRAR